jgi:hypothetical protein
MNILIITTSFVWVIVMAIFIAVFNTTPIKIAAVSVIAINIVSTIYHILRDNCKKSLELRIYTDNLIVLILIILFPKQLFYGYAIQILFSVIITQLYLRRRIIIYDILLYLSVAEMIIYIPLSSFNLFPQLICNTMLMLLLILVIIVIKNKLLLDPEKKYKKILLDTNNIIKHEIIECITPMMYYIRELDVPNKEKMERLINKLKYIAQNNNNSNFGYLITIIKTTMSFVHKQEVSINFVDQTTKNVEIDSYTLLLILYVLFDSSISNSATNIIVKFDNRKIEVIDNGSGFDIKSEVFNRSKLKIALELLDLHDIPVILSSVMGTGTIVTMSIG